MRAVARRAVPARRRAGTAAARTSRSPRRTPSASSSASSTTPTSRRGASCRGTRPTTGTATSPASGPGSATATASTGRGRPSRGHRFNPHKLLIDPYAKAIEGPVLWDRGRTLAYADGDDLVIDTSDDAAAIPKSVVIDQSLRLGGRPAPAAAVGRDRHLRAPREGLHAAAAGRARGPPRHLRGARLGGGDRAPRRPRRHRRRAAADPPHRRRALPPGARPDELLGVLDDRLPRPARRLRRDGDARGAGARVQGARQGDAPGRDRGDPRRRLQPHRRGQPPRPDAVVQGRRQLRLLPHDARRPALLQGLHGHRQLAQPGQPVGAAADHGLAAVLRASSATSTASASTSPRRSPASSTTSTASRPSSTSSTRIRSSPR